MRWHWLLSPKRYAFVFLLLVGAALLALVYPQAVAIWSIDDTTRWAQAAAVLGGVLGVWFLIRAIAVMHLLGVTTKEDWDDRLYLDLVKLAAERVGFFSLGGTFLALMAANGIGDNGVRATALISDLATIGALVGLCSCIPAGISCARRSMRTIKRLDRLVWLRARGALLIIDFLVVLHVFLVLVQAGQGYPFPGST